MAGLKHTIMNEGVWRIRRRERSSVIEVFKTEDSGYGDILSQKFVAWRTREIKPPKPASDDVQVAQANPLDSIHDAA